MAKRPEKSIIFKEKMVVIRRMKCGQSCPLVCRDLHMAPSTVTTIMKKVDKIKMTMETARRKMVTILRY
jgi:hypothetical protein